MSKAILLINASQQANTNAGKLVAKMYYGPFLESVLKDNEYSGYPHNGPEHTLRLKLNVKDLHAFMALVRESFNETLAEAFIQSVYRRMATSTVQVLSNFVQERLNNDEFRTATV